MAQGGQIGPFRAGKVDRSFPVDMTRACTIGIVLSLLAAACSDGQESEDADTGGAGVATGGVGTGAAPGTGGGGAATGGAPTGGVLPTGGAPTGGMPAVGGIPSGGMPTGGMQNTGGETLTGGAPPAGGESFTGGAPGTGGDATGGTDSTGGLPPETGGTDPGGAGGTGGSEPVTCPSTVLGPGDSNETVQVGSATRNYVLHVPNAYDGSSPVPLVVDFHPLGGSGPAERSGSPYPAQTDPEGVIMAFPSGESGPMGGAWNVGPCCVAGAEDVDFARALVAQIQERACIDPKRIYAVGFSMGGGMSHYVACHAADLFAAVAPAAFDLLEENVGGCNPSRPIPVMSFRGTSDPIVPYGGGYSAVVSGMPITFLGATSTLEQWASINSCTGSPTPEDSNGCQTYTDCQDGVEVALCTRQGGGHEAGNASVGWPFLKRFTLP